MAAARVSVHVHFQVPHRAEALTAHRAHVRLLPRVDIGVFPQGCRVPEPLPTQRTLVRLFTGVS